MNIIKKTFIFMLSATICLGLTGCTNKVDKLMSEGNYKEAYDIMKDDPKKYSDVYDECRYNLAAEYFDKKEYAKAYECLKDNKFKDASELMDKVKPLYMNKKILKDVKKGYEYIVDNVKNGWKGKSYLDIDGTEIEAKDYYYAMGDLISSVIKKIDSNEYTIDDNKDEIENIVGYIPDDIQTLRLNLNALQKYFTTNRNEYALNSTTFLFINEDKDYVQTFIDSNDCGHFQFIKLYEMVENEKISSLALSCILGLYKSYGADVQFNDYIDVNWNKATRGYDYCAPNSQWNRILAWENNVKIECEQYLDGADGLVKYYVDNSNGYNFKFISFYTIIYDGNDNHIATEYSRKENVTEDPIEMEFRIKNVDFNTEYKWVTYTCGILNQ